MATNWNMRDGVKAILSGDKEAMVDIGRRFPLTAIAIAQMGNNEGALAIINALPDHITVRKIESVLKDGVQELSDDAEEIMPKPEESKTSGRGRKKTEKEEPVKAKEKKATAKKNNEDDDDLDSMSEVELFKLCKKKGIKAAPKQDKAYYIDLLTPADSDDEEDEEWDDEEEEKPTKKDKKTVKKSKKDEDDDEDDDWNI